MINLLKFLKNKKLTLIVISLLFFFTPAFALDVKSYEELKKSSEDILKVHINGVGNGYDWSNSILQNRGEKVFYCPPQKISLNAGNYIDIIDSQIIKKPKLIDSPVELILFMGLVESFPCQK